MIQAVITGVSRGIGRELVREFNHEGYVVLGISRDEEQLEQLKKELEYPDAFIYVVGDAGSKNVLSEVEQHLQEKGGPLYIINNAGLLVSKPFSDLVESEVMGMVQTNLLMPVRLLQRLVPYAERQEKLVHVVNISSMGGYQGAAKFAGLSLYSATKGALATLSECLAEEWKETNIRCNALALGAAQTEMLAKAFPGYSAPVSASEMASFIYDFATRAHYYLNGKVIPVSLSSP